MAWHARRHVQAGVPVFVPGHHARAALLLSEVDLLTDSATCRQAESRWFKMPDLLFFREEGRNSAIQRLAAFEVEFKFQTQMFVSHINL